MIWKEKIGQVMVKELNYFLQQMIQLTDEAKKEVMLLCCCESATYRIFKGLAAPAKPADKTFSDLVSLIKDHQNPKRNPIYS